MDQTRFCEQCGTELETGSRFCEWCGASVSPEVETAATPPLSPPTSRRSVLPLPSQPAPGQKNRIPSLWMILGSVGSCSSLVCGVLVFILGSGGSSITSDFPVSTFVNLPPASTSQAATAINTIPATLAPATQSPVMPSSTDIPLVTALPSIESPETTEQAGARDLTGFQDDFSSDINPWRPQEQNGSVQISDGKLNLAVTKTGKYLTAKIPWYVTSPVKDVTLSMTAVVLTPGLGAFGLICRAADLHNFYMVSIESDAAGGGRYSFIKDKNSSITYLIDAEKTSLLHGGEIPEKVLFSCMGDTLRLELNGKLVKEVRDSDIQGGDAYLFASSADDVSASNPFKVAIDDFTATMP